MIEMIIEYKYNFNATNDNNNNINNINNNNNNNIFIQENIQKRMKIDYVC